MSVSLVRGFAVNRPISSGLHLMAVGLGGQTGRWRCAELRCQGGLGHCVIHSVGKEGRGGIDMGFEGKTRWRCRAIRRK